FRAHAVQFAVNDDYFHAGTPAQTLRNLLCQIDGAMLASGASERDHEMLESAALIVANAGVQQRHDACQKLMHALLLVEIVDDWRVAARKLLESLFAARIRKAPPIENEAAAVAAFVFRQAAVEREADNAHHEAVGIRRQSLQLLRRQHTVKCIHQ